MGAYEAVPQGVLDVVAEGCRYLSILVSNTGQELVAIKVTGHYTEPPVVCDPPCGVPPYWHPCPGNAACVSYWVAYPPECLWEGGPCATHLACEPVYKTAAEWGTVHLTGAGIYPSATYTVEVFSETCATPWWRAQ
jgi:hypothetical protein